MHERYDDMYEAALRYYIHDETMEAIARHLCISRSSVSRLLAKAREDGLVRITLADHAGSRSATANTIARRFGVKVHVATVGDSLPMSARFDRVSRMAAALFKESVTDGQLIGVAWGVTLSNIVQRLDRRPLRDATIVQMNGGANSESTGAPHVGAILEGLGQAFDARIVHFPVPAFFDYAETRQAMWRERSVRRVRDMQQRLDIAIFGVGSLHGKVPSHVYTAGYLDAADIAQLVREGAVGDVCTVLLREDGTYADISYNERATGLAPDELSRVPKRICVVADPARAPAVVGALRAGVVTDLVCDDVTAQAVAVRL
jgi:DNA-binding transcriptional regulator LsrR (DeoR family)